MTQWWESLSFIQQIFACVAIPATLILILQTLLLLFGLTGHGDTGEHDHDCDHDCGHDFSHDSGHDCGYDFSHDSGHEIDSCDTDDDFDVHDFEAHDDVNTDHESFIHGHHHNDSGLRIFTVRSIIAFFSIFGWMGIVLTDWKVNAVLTVIVSSSAGFASMAVMAFFFKFAMTLQSSGNINQQNALGKTATVYIPIPPNRTGKGKINAIVQNRFTEMDAVTDSDSYIRTGTEVVCVSVSNQNIICVTPINGN